MRRQTSVLLGADGKENAMKSMMEIIYVLMIVIGLAMIVYDVISAKTAAPLNSVRKKEGFAKAALKR
jgi:preprotein translocase subunit SecG